MDTATRPPEPPSPGLLGWTHDRVTAPTLEPVTALLRPLLAACAGALLLAGCGGSSSPVAATSPAPASPAAAPSPSASPCPATAATQAWPKSVPSALPVPPTSAMGKETRTKEGLTVLRFSTSQSLRDGVLFLVKELQPAGFTLGRGDAEPTEADVPFTRGQLRGLMKMIAVEPCQTQWVLALQSRQSVVPAATLPPLLPRYTSASPSPLPFG